MEKLIYYVVENRYVGPNSDQDKYVDADWIEIRTTPAVYNSSHENCINGWCGTTNEWSVHAYGAFKDIEEARDAIVQAFGDVRDRDIEGFLIECHDDVVEVYKSGKYVPLSYEGTQNWIDNALHLIDSDTSDEKIYELIGEFEEEANKHGLTLSVKLEEILIDFRNDLIDRAQKY